MECVFDVCSLWVAFSVFSVECAFDVCSLLSVHSNVCLDCAEQTTTKKKKNCAVVAVHCVYLGLVYKRVWFVYGWSNTVTSGIVLYGWDSPVWVG